MAVVPLGKGRQPVDGRLMRAGAVPGTGLVTLFRGGSEPRPAGHDAGLPGAGCPGSGSVVRCHEARDRTAPKSARLWARAAVERRKASASVKSGRAPRGKRKAEPQGLSASPRNLPPRLSALRLPFDVEAAVRAQRGQTSGRATKRAARERGRSSLRAPNEGI